MRLSNAGVVLAVGCSLATFAAGPAAALEPGVFVNPTSPAGQQYSYPLSVLRGQAAGQRAPSSESPTPLFGVGITAAASPGHARTLRGHGPSSAGSAARRTAKDRPASRRPAIHGAKDPARSVARHSSATPARVNSPASALPRNALIVALVLVLGGGIGVGLRRIARRD